MNRNQHVSISNGNLKLGAVMNISLPPVRCCPVGVPCATDGCYALKAWRLYPGTREAWSRNARIAKRDPESYFAQIAARVAAVKPPLFRWHVAGDILSIDYLRGMCKVARTHPHTQFFTFTKAFDAVNSYESREAMPNNLVVIFSAWPGMAFDNPLGHRVAWMQDGTETRVPKNAIRCPGHCETCALCSRLPRLGRDVVFRRH